MFLCIHLSCMIIFMNCLKYGRFVVHHKLSLRIVLMFRFVDFCSCPRNIIYERLLALHIQSTIPYLLVSIVFLRPYLYFFCRSITHLSFLLF
ncbi:hypothetical protein ES332_D03G124100v1 [Gossypium tomentosum]|uniref:Uncharacterized protein n=1 Tax=Gossypium tomentosum TaxID=34277 RepID=A0A5D2LMJ1_GOSTO|nr:hypothetical protein ES332_D03G124100v1 [Gossypium tomentosum]